MSPQYSWITATNGGIYSKMEPTVWNFLIKCDQSKCSGCRVNMNTNSVRRVSSLPAVQPRTELLLQLQQFQVGFWVLVTEEEDDLQPLHQLLQAGLCTHLGCLGQVLFMAIRRRRDMSKFFLLRHSVGILFNSIQSYNERAVLMKHCRSNLIKTMPTVSFQTSKLLINVDEWVLTTDRVQTRQLTPTYGSPEAAPQQQLLKCHQKVNQSHLVEEEFLICTQAQQWDATPILHLYYVNNPVLQYIFPDKEQTCVIKRHYIPLTSSMLSEFALLITFSCCLRRKCVWSGSRLLKSPLMGRLRPRCLAELK